MIQARGHAARQARREDAAKAFRDVAKPRALPVQTLALKTVSTVTEVDHSAKTIRHHPANLLCDDMAVGPLGPLPVQTHQPGQISLQQEPGDTLTQTQLRGSRAQVAQDFLNLWNPMWNRHCDHNPSHWDRFATDLRPHLPCFATDQVRVRRLSF